MKSAAAAASQNENGYAMAGLLVAIAVMSILMSAAMPVWKQAAQREKEEELIFRGQQYAHAIALFQRKSGNAMPPNVNVLVEQRFLRKKYKDPITNDDFMLLTMDQANAARAAVPAASARAGRSGQTQQVSPATTTPLAGGSATPPARGGSQLTTLMNAFIGVVSKSKEKSIRLYQGKNHYNEWAFIYVPQSQTPGAGAARVPTPGARVAPGVTGQRSQRTFAGRGRTGAGRSVSPGRRLNPGGFTPFPQLPMGPPTRGRSGR